MNRAPDHLLRRVDPPGAPPSLRTRALAAARVARRKPEPVDLWSRIWASRPLRLAWAASLTAVLAAHVALSVRSALEPIPSAAADGGAFLIASTVSDDELRTLVDLPNIALDTLPTFESPTLDPHS